MKKFFLDSVDKFCKETIESEVEQLCSIGTPSVSPVLKQSLFAAEAKFEEICHIVPNKPLFKKGWLIGSSERILLEDKNYRINSSGRTGKFINSANNFDAVVDIGTVKEIDELGEIKRVLKSEVVMVVGETIEIKKSIKSQSWTLLVKPWKNKIVAILCATYCKW